MFLRNQADYRTILWVGLAVALVAIQYTWPSTVWFLSPVSCYLAVACGVISHNHNHQPTFSIKRLNYGFGHLLTFFYGYPTLMWIPTHNLNHHLFTNRPGDATITWRHTNLNNLWVVLTYPFVSGFYQSEAVKTYIQRTKLKNRKMYARILFQYTFWVGSYGFMLWLAWFLHHADGNRTGLYVWFFSVLLPAISSATVIMMFNYVQHVHADAWSDHDHSRNFTSRSFNFLFFNNGYHTAHHQRPGLHWSLLREAHEQIAPRIDPALNEPSLWWFVIRQYFLAPFIPSLGTQQIGAAPSQTRTN